MKKKSIFILCFSFLFVLMFSAFAYNADTLNKNNSPAFAFAFADENFSETENSDIENDLVSYNLTLVFGNGYENQVFELAYGDNLMIERPNIEGLNFVGWFLEEEFINEFSETTMPEENLTLYAKFEALTYNIVFYFNNNTLPETVSVNYGEKVVVPETIEKTGFSFAGWFYDDGTFERPFDTNLSITESFSVYAKWQRNLYTLEVVLGNGNDSLIYNISYEENMVRPDNPTFKNHNFIGWFTDQSLNTRFIFGSMPANNVKVYAGWQAKKTVPVILEKQVYELNASGAFFKDYSNVLGFNVQYFVDGEWTSEIPKEAGIYHVKISRSEDNYYASYEAVLKDGFEIKYKEMNMTWLVALLFIICFLELAAIIFVKKLKKLKTSNTYAIFPIVFGEGLIIPNTQFILIIVSGTFALLGFIYLIYSLVDVHKSAKNDSYLPSKLDNRERFKDELIFQNTNEGDNDYVSETKTDQSFGDKYSAEDVINMLDNDNFSKETIEKRKFNIEENSSVNWNKVSETDGSDIISKAKDINSLRQGEYGGKTTTKFFEDDD